VSNVLGGGNPLLLLLPLDVPMPLLLLPPLVGLKWGKAR
jgi:hypothetical protein